LCQSKGVGVSRTIKGAAVIPETPWRPARGKSLMLCFQEKSRRELIGCPYRKPTQVGEEKILRRLRELSSKELGKFPP
jgi:hypothetical protein